MAFSKDNKLVVKSYADPRYEEELTDVDPFTVHLNPESYSLTTQINFSEEQAPGTSANQNNHNNTQPVTLDLDFLLDRTGALGNEADAQNGVEEDIEHFRKIAIDFEGELHQPRYLMLCWGSLIFKCQLEKLEVEYKLFNPEGKPLRANLKCSFREFKEENLRVAEENASSPDLTHVRIARAGDTLPLMCHRIYGDPRYYLAVAKYNKLPQFRSLSQGQRLVFPPIEKVANA